MFVCSRGHALVLAVERLDGAPGRVQAGGRRQGPTVRDRTYDALGGMHIQA